MSSIGKRFDRIKEIIETDGFLNNKTQGGELGFYIFDYDPKDEIKARSFVEQFIQSYKFDSSIIKPVELDLFELMIKILDSQKIKDKTILDEIPLMEEKDGTLRLEKGLTALLKPQRFIALIEEKVKNANLVLITGVGKVWPLVRSHTILNNLHHVLDKVPVIMFYPGAYDQKDLRLFKSKVFAGITDDNYYRAFKLVEDDV